MSQHLADAVFEGGGVKAIGLVGALEVMESAGYAWNLVAGASAGAIVAALVAAGYRSAELAEILDGLDFRRFKDEGALDAIPLLGKPVSFLFEKGVYEGRALEAWVGEMLAARGVRVFGDLHAPRGSAYEHRLQVLVSDVTEGRILVAPSGLEHYGLDPDAFPVARAVRMSASIPFFFEPVVESGHYFVDGGLLSNFPVWLFDREPAARSRREPVPRWPTFGFKLVGPEEGRAQPIGSLLDYVRALVETMLESHDKRHIEDFDALRTILVPTAGVRTTDFGLAPARRAELYEAGRRAALAFQAGWDAEDYVRAARRPTTATGRAARERYRERVSRRSARMIGARAYRR